MVAIVKDGAGNDWEVVSNTRRTYTAGCVTRWIARRTWYDGKGQVQHETLRNPSGRTKRFHTESACIAALTGEHRPALHPAVPGEALW